MNPAQQIKMSAPESETTWEKLQVQGLEYFAQVDAGGSVLQDRGAPDEDVLATWPLLMRQAGRLGEVFGLDEPASVRAFFDQRQLYLQQSNEAIQGMVAMKKANTTRLLNSLQTLA